MNKPRMFVALTIFGIVFFVTSRSIRAQQQDAIKEHATKIIDLLKLEKFDEVAKEFNAQVAAALTPAQLGTAWANIHTQAGDFKSIIDQQVTSQGGYTVVVTGCQFEKANLNSILAFDSDNKIGGLRFVPRS